MDSHALADRASPGAAGQEQKPTRLEVEAEASIVELPDEALPDEVKPKREQGRARARAAGSEEVKPAPVAMVASSATLVRGEPVSVLRATQTAAGVEASLTLTGPSLHAL